jgi:hypothetical protein
MSGWEIADVCFQLAKAVEQHGKVRRVVRAEGALAELDGPGQLGPRRWQAPSPRSTAPRLLRTTACRSRRIVPHGVPQLAVADPDEPLGASPQGSVGLDTSMVACRSPSVSSASRRPVHDARRQGGVHESESAGTGRSAT